MAVATADIFVKPYQEYRRNRTESRPGSAHLSAGPSQLRSDVVEFSDGKSERLSGFASRSDTNVSELPPHNRSADQPCFSGTDKKRLQGRPMSPASATGSPESDKERLDVGYGLYRSQSDMNTVQGSSEHSPPSTSSEIVHSSSKGKGKHIAAVVAAASGKSVAQWFGTCSKGIFLDVPLAVAEGMRQTPNLYGEKVHEYGKITGWKSGAVFAAKNLGVGLAEGLSDVFVQPVKGGIKDGTLGVIKGLGKGTVGLVTKTGSAGIGVLAYTGQGVYKSIHRSRHAHTRDEIRMLKQLEGTWLLKRHSEVNRGLAIAKYDSLR